MKVVIAKQILKANDQIAAGNQARFDNAGVYTVNVLGSPGAGKTSLLERLADRLGIAMAQAVSPPLRACAISLSVHVIPGISSLG